jgi:DNA modification methylase
MSSLFDGFSVPSPSRPNRLFYGDNLTIMRNLPSVSVDLIYLDPPFNSQRNYNLIYKQMTGLPVPEQEEAFCDAWELDPEKEEMARRMPIILREYDVDEQLVLFWQSWIMALRHTQPRLLAYLIYMTYRLFEMHRLLRPTGSIYLHCDPTASHYIKVMMDGIFGHKNFRNEIVWKRTFAHSSAKRWGDVHDTLLFYTKSDHYTWNRPLQALDLQYVAGKYRHTDAQGRYRLVVLTAPGIRYGASGRPWRGYDPTSAGRHWAVPKRALKDLASQEITIPDDLHGQLELLYQHGCIRFPQKKGGSVGVPEFKLYLPQGQPVQDVVTDIPPLNSQAKERLGYPTQKPLVLLKRIIEASSREGDVVFDPFCGCGTAIYASHLTQRNWIGCDIAILSVRLVREVLLRRYGLEEGRDYEVSGVPLSLEGAHELFNRDPHQFQNWAVELAGGFCSVRRSGDRGVDGRIYYETSTGLRSMVISVKGGHLSPAYIRELRGTMERENNAELGGFICLEKPTKGMWRDVAEAGVYTYMGKPYDRLQIRTIGDLLDGKAFDTPSRVQTMNWDRQIHLPL